MRAAARSANRRPTCATSAGAWCRVAPGPKYPYTLLRGGLPRDQRVCAAGRSGLDSPRRAAGGDQRVAGGRRHRARDRPHRAAARRAASLTNGADRSMGPRPARARLLGNSGGAGAAQVAAGLLANGAFLKFSRDDEREADRVGLAMMTAAGWDGRGMIELFEILRRAAAAATPAAVEVFLSTPSVAAGSDRASCGPRVAAGGRSRQRRVRSRCRSVPRSERGQADSSLAAQPPSVGAACRPITTGRPCQPHWRCDRCCGSMICASRRLCPRTVDS